MATSEGGLFTNPTGLGSPSIATYMQDMWKGWGLQVPRLVQQWTGDFFEDSALHMAYNYTSAMMEHPVHPHLQMCKPPSADTHSQQDWMKRNGKTLTTSPSTFICQWDQKSYHKQLLHTKLYPSTFEKPSMVFTFLVLDDFLRDNVECRMSGMNYYSKLCWVTSRNYCGSTAMALLKLLKWSGYQGNLNDSMKGDLALFCVACPQPGINLSPQANLDDWRYTRTVVMDGNFKVEHMHEQRPDDQVWLMDGHSFMVTNLQYQEYIAATPHIMEKSACNNHKAISQTSASHGKLNSMEVGATACAQHGCFYPHSVVDFQKGKRQLNMDYSLCNALSYNMNGIQNVICFYDVNCTYMKNLWRWVDNTKFLEITPSLRIVAGIGMWHVHRHKKECYARYSPLFIRGSGWVDSEIIETLWSTLNIVSASTCRMTLLHRQELLDFQMNDSNFMKMICMISSLLQKLKENWWRQEEAALKDHVHDPSVMDIFEIQLTKVHGIELHLLQTSAASGMHHRAASWLTHGLVIKEVEVMLSINRVAAEWKTFIMDGRIYLQMDTALDDSKESDRNHEVASQNIFVDDDTSSNGGNSDCSADDMQDTNTFMDPTSPTLPLPSNLGADRCHDIGIHQLAEMELELHIAQANDTLHGLHLALADKAVIFRGVVRSATNYSMRTWAWQMDRHDHPGKPEILEQYQELQKSHLTTKSTGSAKAGKDHWEEEEELLTLEFQWVINYF
ncbi:hypothetical protein F5141DRAFT_1067903 [Pisolithus sp. B1]|nr:hypothetical protein F5141DRAFT_1067903 [Pisolithus sp. B1]